MEIAEFTCLCPMTGQPDFATLYLEYVPDRRCVELKSLKLYIWSYRDDGAYHARARSEFLPELDFKVLARFVRQSNQTRAVRGFRDHLRRRK